MIVTNNNFDELEEQKKDSVMDGEPMEEQSMPQPPGGTSGEDED